MTNQPQPANDGRLVEPFTIAVFAFTAAVTTVWGGAALAALVTHGSAQGVAVSAAGQAVTRLPAHLSDPKQAWPPPAAAVLPGPIFYWLCQVAVLAALASLGFLAWRLSNSRRSGRPSSKGLGVDGEAGFAKPRDLARLRVRAATPGRITLGRCGPRLLACEPQASLAVIGPTGCGKTAGFAIPALLEWHGPVLATSVKADLLEATIGHRSKQGKVWVYDPTRSAVELTATWTPLPACKTWAGAMQMAAWMTEAAQARLDTVTDGDYWYTQARKALAPYLYAAAISGRDMAGVVRWIDTQEQADVHTALRVDAERRLGIDQWDALRAVEADKGRALLRARMDTPPEWLDLPVEKWPQVERAQIDANVNDEWQKLVADRNAIIAAPMVAAQALWNKEKRLRGSVFATVENVLAAFADPGVTAAATDCEIDFAEWLAGDNTIYIVAAAHEQARLRPVLTVLAQQAIRAAYDTANTHGGTLEQPCLLLLDEAGNTAPLRDLPGYASTARSHGITLITVWQDLAQIKATYRDRAQTVLNNHRAKLFGTGIADDTTLDYLSRLIGDEQRTDTNTSAELRSDRRTVSEHHTYRRAAPVDVLRRIQPDTAVLVYGSELPAVVQLRPWYLDETLRTIADRADLIREPIGKPRARLRR